MNSFTRDYRSLLTEEYEPPCVSIYFPTHRSSPEKLQDPIRFRNLIRQAEKDLREKYPDADANAILAPFRELLEDDSFWNDTLDGIGILGSGGKVTVYPLNVEVGEEVLVADRFYTRPLMSIFEPPKRYHVLGVELHKIKLFEGDEHAVRRIELGPDAPATIEAALGDQLTDRYMTLSSNARGTASTFHGGRSREDEDDIDGPKYFRIIDRWVFENYSRPSGYPLILAALPQRYQEFRSISKNPLLEPEGIEVDCSSLSPEEMIAKATEIVNRHRIALEEETIKQFGFAYGRENASGDIAEIARAVADGRVATLLLESGRRVGGTIDEATGAVEYSDEPMAPDLLGQLGEMVIRTSGEVFILPADRMPVTTGVGGIFRY